MSEIIEQLDKEIKQQKKEIEVIQEVRNDLQELNNTLDHEEHLNEFIEDNYDRVYEEYCECYPEEIHSDFMLEDRDWGDILDFVVGHFTTELENKYPEDYKE